MLKVHNPIVITLLLLLSAPACGLDFSGIDIWSDSKRYQRGDIIKTGSVPYIALLPSQNAHPQQHPVIWRHILLKSDNPVKLKKLYLPGHVVKHNGDQFLSLKINMLMDVSHLQNKRQWLVITDTSNEYKPPYDHDNETANTLYGADNNNNGIRDDYEQRVIQSELPETVQRLAFAAGRIYTTTVLVGRSSDEISAELARQTMQNLIHVYRCKLTTAQQFNGNTWQESWFYNTVDRLEAKFLIQNALSKTAGEKTEYQFPDDSCAEILKEGLLVSS